ncbi:FAD/NAD(P)-binding protein [Streptomyces sp. BR1]|uniref:FAD/NAD(P)-binding protein n=1 Tax=Streptomyces sp. BR1 TaxID=1592323 RepID=UPI00402B4664
MSSTELTVCVVGAGPRGLSVLERLCANERAAASHAAVTIHLVDPERPGAGRVWRTDQPRELLMNTVASQATVYTDASVEMAGPVETGPSLHDWARGLCGLSRLQELLGGYDDATLAEARRLGADDYPTRAFYGRYLEDCFRTVVTGAPEHVTVIVHRSTAVALDDHSGAQTLRLANGTLLTGLDAVVLTLGHVRSRATTDLARRARALGLKYLPPANPADLDLSPIGPGESVVLRGLGLSFFDHMALFTGGRGGRFEPDPHRPGRLRYLPSGREPRLLAGSRRGLPYQARGENEKGAHGRHTPRLLTPQTIEKLRQCRDDGERPYFSTSLWPLIAAEVEAVYYRRLLTTRGRAADGAQLAEAYASASDEDARAELVRRFGIADDDRWDWEHTELPYWKRTFTDPDDFRDWLLAYLGDDVRRARGGNVSDPHKAAVDVLRDLRNEIRLVVDHAGLDGDSHRDELDGWYTRLDAFLSIGPPVSRIEEMAALIEAGVLTVVGPGIQVRVDRDDPAFVVESPAVPGARYRASALIEARLPAPDLRETADPLLRRMLDTGQCRAFRIPAACGRTYETGGLEITRRPNHVVDAQGRAHQRRFAFGVPTESVRWLTAAGARPGVDSVLLGDADAIARAVLSLSPAYTDGTAPADRLTEVTA